MYSRDLISRIDPRWRPDFERFIETGQASEEFLDFVDTNRECQEVLDQILAAQSASLDVVRQAAQGSQPAFVHQQASPGRAGWRALQPYALAASLLCVLLLGVVVWSVAAVGRGQARRLAAQEAETVEALRARDAAAQKVANLADWAADLKRQVDGGGDLRAKLAEAQNTIDQKETTIKQLRGEREGQRGLVRLTSLPSVVETTGLFQGQVVVRALVDPVTGHVTASEIKPTVHISGGEQLPRMTKVDFKPGEGEGKPGLLEIVLDLAPQATSTEETDGKKIMASAEQGRQRAPAAATSATAASPQGDPRERAAVAGTVSRRPAGAAAAFPMGASGRAATAASAPAATPTVPHSSGPPPPPS